jgi:hypothetical protein
MSRASVGLLLLAAVSCGSPNAPTTERDVRGVWSGPGQSWRWSTSALYAEQSFSVGCDGALTIDQQSGDTFTGRYEIGCLGAGQSKGAVLEGRVGPSTKISFQLRADEGWSPAILPTLFNTPCQFADPGVYEGTLTNESISANRVQVADCTAGRVILTATFRAERR